MRLSPAVLVVCTVLLACDDPVGLDPNTPTLTAQEISYWAYGNEVHAYVTATSPAGPVQLACVGSITETSIDTSAVDTLYLQFPLGDRSRSAGVAATLECEASAGEATLPFTLTLDDPGVPDSAPVFDSLAVYTYQQPDTAASFTIGLWLQTHDDFRLQQLTIAQSDSAACPCSESSPMVILGSTWYGAIFHFVYTGPGMYYLRFTLTDDAGQSTTVWRGPIQVPQPPEP